MPAPPTDSFQIILLLRREDPLALELAATGWPLYRATNMSDAVRTAASGPAVLFVNAAELEQTPPGVRLELERVSQSGRLKTFIVHKEFSTDAPAFAENLVLGDRPRAQIIDELAPKMVANQRSAVRATVSMPATFADEQTLTGSVLSLSEGGAMFASPVCPTLGETGRLSIQISPSERCEVLATVVNQRQRAVGLRFADVSPELAAKLKKWVALALGGSSPTSETRRMLMLEASPLALKAHSAIFAGAGFEVSIVAHPGDAIRQLAKAKHDVILVEPTMPELAGDRLKELVRQAAPVPVVLLSGSPTLRVIQEKNGAFGILQKGLFADMMLMRLNTMLGNR